MRGRVLGCQPSEEAKEHERYQSLIAAQSKALALCHQETRSQHNDLAVKIMKVNQGGREGRWPLAELSLPDCTYDSTHCSAFCGLGAPGGGGSSMQAIRLVHLVQVEELQTFTTGKKNIQTSSLK